MGGVHTANVMGMGANEEAQLHGRAGLKLASISGNATAYVIVANTS